MSGARKRFRVSQLDTCPDNTPRLHASRKNADAARMGRVHAVTSAVDSQSRTTPLTAVLRAADFVIAGVALVVALPLIGLLALAVRQSSHGPVLQRQRSVDRKGRPVQLLSFRTALDGASTVHHSRMRAIVGASDRETLTAVGRVMRATRLDRLPRLYNIAAGHAGLLGR